MKTDTTAAAERAAGMGGSYLVDPKTGKTSLAHRTGDPTPGAGQDPSPESAAPAAKPEPAVNPAA